MDYTKLKQVLSGLQQEIIPHKQQYQIKDSPILFSKENLKAYNLLRKKHTFELESMLLQAGFTTFSNIHPHIHYSIHKMQNNYNMKKIHDLKDTPLTPEVSHQIKQNRNVSLLGKNKTSIMVTLQASMLENPKIIHDLLSQGMNIARINCAHDSPAIWKRLVETIRRAESELGMNGPPCKIHMELAGPKIRVKKIYYPEKHTENERPFFNVKQGDIITIARENYATDLSLKKDKIFSINSPKALWNVQVKDRVYFNDGKIIGQVCFVKEETIGIEVIKTTKKSVKIREESGVNFPDSFVHFIMPAITETDIEILPLVYELSDTIGLSFVHYPRDLEKFRELLSSFPPKNIGVIAKIETKEAFHNLTKIIIEGLSFDAFGIMIARGDLAIELGFTNLASIQEEIIHLCQAAHIPFIWATGVLENLTKKGMPLRSEMTDAFHGLQADCVMLNKGDYIIEAVKTVNDLIALRNRVDKRNSLLPFIQYGY